MLTFSPLVGPYLLPPYHLHLYALASATQVCKGRWIKGPQTFYAHLGDVSASYSINLGNWGMMISFSTWKLYNSFGLTSKMVPVAKLKPILMGESKIIPTHDSQYNLRHAAIPLCTSDLKMGWGMEKEPNPLGIQDLGCDLLKIKSSFPASNFTCVIQELREPTLLRFTISLHSLCTQNICKAEERFSCREPLW